MLHVFVETNWVVDCAAPAHNKVQAALDLLQKANKGEIQLHLPAICLAEARHPLSAKFQTRQAADRVRQFVTWAISTNQLRAEQGEAIRSGVDLMEKLTQKPGLDVFPLNAAMLTRSTGLCFELPDLKPYDQAVLAAILVRAEELMKSGERKLVFCELDSDLQPWDKARHPKPKLTELYDRANVWVYSDYLLLAPGMPDGWYQRDAPRNP